MAVLQLLAQRLQYRLLQMKLDFASDYKRQSIGVL